MLSPTWDTFRLSLHILAATVWVGGQITLAGLVPTLRSVSAETTTKVARQFARISWPAFAVLVATGIWNVVANHPSHRSGTWNVTLDLKVAVVIVAGLSAWLHTKVKTKPAIAAWGAVSGLSAVGALFVGVLLAG